MSDNCFMCGIDVDGQVVRSPLPKELLELDPNGMLSEDLQPICKKCNTFRKVVDHNFVRLCEDARLFEWYRCKSKKSGEYFPPTFIYNIPVERLRELYYQLLDVCEEANRIASDDVHRKELEDNLNYEWRQKYE